MIKTTKLIVLLLALIIGGAACNSSSNTDSKDETNLPEGTHKIKVKEVIHATSYTYLRADQDGKEVWIAINKQDIPAGEILYYRNGLEMHDFESSDLQRTFDTIFFVQDISKVPIIPDRQPQSVMGSTEAQKPVLKKINVDVEIPENGVEIGDLYKNTGKYKDQSVIVRGKVTKVNPNIMDRNWIHIQDGTGDEQHFDLTVTTNDMPEVGEVVTYKGTIGIERDFGMGYAYEILLENAERVNEQ